MLVKCNFALKCDRTDCPHYGTHGQICDCHVRVCYLKHRKVQCSKVAGVAVKRAVLGR